MARRFREFYLRNLRNLREDKALLINYPSNLSSPKPDHQTTRPQIMDTLNKFLHLIDDRDLFKKEEPILLAVSGGVDSMVMCDLFKQAGFRYGIAHVNFTLRGEDSDQDEQFVRNYAEKNNIPFFSTRFSTEQLAKEEKKSIQVIARELRYKWLEKIRGNNDYQLIATAHHANDSLETVLYNWTKGSGLKGLLGVPLKNDLIIRPLSLISKNEIERYAQVNKLLYREDASNQEDKYNRNKIRHHVIPILKEINPSLEQSVLKNLIYLKDVQSLFEWAVYGILKELCEKRNGEVRLDFVALEKFPAPQTILFEWLKEFGFNSSQVSEIWESRNKQAGKKFFSKTHQLLVDRQFYILVDHIEENILGDIYTLEKYVTSLYIGEAQLKIELLSTLPKEFSFNPYEVIIDAQELNYPLTIRHWKEGDSFCPLGMNGHSKKLSDFFTDQKISRIQKDKVWILEDNKKRICWIIGLRMDERFKITAKTQSVYKIIFQP